MADPTYPTGVPTWDDGTPKDKRDWTILEQAYMAANPPAPPAPEPTYGAPTAVAIDNTAVATDAAVGDIVGTLTTTDDGTGDRPDTYTYTLNDPKSFYAIDVDKLKVAAAPDAGDDAITVTTTGMGSGKTFDQALTITATAPTEQP